MTTVEVASVQIEWAPGLDYILFSCGHAVVYPTDPPNESLVGAFWECERCGTARAWPPRLVITELSPGVHRLDAIEDSSGQALPWLPAPKFTADVEARLADWEDRQLDP